MKASPATAAGACAMQNGTVKAGLLFMAAVSLLVSTGCSEAEPDPRTLPPIVRVTTAGQNGGAANQFTGVVASRVQSDIGFRVGGRIMARRVNVGESVRPGQVLLQLDGSDLALAAAAQEQAVVAARARAAQAASEERRVRDLVAAGWVSKRAFDQVQNAAAAAAADLRAAEAQAAVARNAAHYAVLSATAPGIVVQTLAEPGQVVAAGQPVLRLAGAGPREAVINLPETVRPALGSVATATLYNGAGTGTARLRQLSNAADPRTRTFEARYVLEGPAAAAALGSSVTIALAGSGEPGIRIPVAALRDAGKGPGVWVLTPDRRHVRWRPVTLAALGEEEITIGSGLAADEAFVAMGAHLLHDGQEVRPARASGSGL